jgi:hypothetical protein
MTKQSHQILVAEIFSNSEEYHNDIKNLEFKERNELIIAVHNNYSGFKRSVGDINSIRLT